MTNTSSSQALKEFLEWEHAKQYVGTDDDMPDACNAWISNLIDDDVCRMVLAVFREGL